MAGFKLLSLTTELFPLPLFSPEYLRRIGLVGGEDKQGGRSRRDIASPPLPSSPLDFLPLQTTISSSFPTRLLSLTTELFPSPPFPLPLPFPGEGGSKQLYTPLIFFIKKVNRLRLFWNAIKNIQRYFFQPENC